MNINSVMSNIHSHEEYQTVIGDQIDILNTLLTEKEMNVDDNYDIIRAIFTENDALHRAIINERADTVNAGSNLQRQMEQTK